MTDKRSARVHGFCYVAEVQRAVLNGKVKDHPLRSASFDDASPFYQPAL